MISSQQIEKLVKEIPQNKIEEMIKYLKGKNPSNLNSLIVQDDLKLNSSQTKSLEKILKQTEDGNLLSVTIDTVLSQHKQNKNEISRLVMSWDFQHKDADITHDTIHQMIERVKFKITIIGYFVYDMGDFFEKLSDLSAKGIEITFILDKAEKWEAKIKKNWNKKSLPKIFKINRDVMEEGYTKEQLNKIHSKIIIIDDSEILITSANLTIYAMEKNIETGIWTSDKTIIKACREIFDDFKRKKVIVPVTEKKY